MGIFDNIIYCKPKPDFLVQGLWWKFLLEKILKAQDVIWKIAAFECLASGNFTVAGFLFP